MPSPIRAISDQRGFSFVEYLVITGAIGLVLVAAAVMLQGQYAEALIERSFRAMGVQ